VKTEIENKLSEKIFELSGKRISSIDEELVESGLLTSITMAELALEIEKIFSVQLSFMEVSKENFRSVGALTKLILQKTA